MDPAKAFILSALTNLLLYVFSVKVNIANNSSLEQYLCHNQIQSGMTLILLSTSHYSVLNKNFCIVQNVSNVMIRSQSSENAAKINCFDNWNGFGFYNTTNLTLYGLVFYHCGCEIQLPYNVHEHTNKSNLYIGSHQRAVLLFSNCFNTTVHSVIIQGPYHGFGMIFVNALGTSNITRVNVSDNLRDKTCPTIGNWMNYSCTGSGIVLVFLDNTFINGSQNMTVLLTCLRVNNNRNAYLFSKSFVDIFKQRKSPILSGTGLTLLYFSTCTINVGAVDLDISNNQATHVGAVLIAFKNTSIQNIGLSQMIIEKNIIPYTNSFSLSAGVTIISVLGPGNFALEHSFLSITTSNISFNQAHKGGGILMHFQPYSDPNIFFELSNCNFVGNQAYLLGSAMLIDTSKLIRHHSLAQTFFRVRMNTVYAAKNSGPLLSIPVQFDVSVFAFKPTRLEIEIFSSKFFNNTGSVFYVYGSRISIFGYFLCTNNTSKSGSCLHLAGLSWIQTTEKTFCIFSHNKALLSGGAIYGDNLGIPFDICTIAPKTRSERVIMKFENNLASLDGRDIKSHNLYNCSLLFDVHISMEQGTYEFYKKVLQFNQSLNTSISSTVNRLYTTANETHLKMFSGQTIHIPLIAVDAANNPVYTTVMLSTYPSNSHQWITEGESIYNVYANVKNILKFKLASTTITKSTGKIAVHTTSFPSVNLIFKVSIFPCPKGFSASSINHSCDCSPFLKHVDKRITCDVQNVTIALPHSSWFGIIKNNDLGYVEAFSYNCPPEYCKHTSIFNPSTNLQDPLCKHNRTGIMCGQCAEGLSLVFGSDECHQCSNLWVLSLLMYALIGMGMVVILFSIKFTVSSGMIGGMIFFANVALISLHSDLLSKQLYAQIIKILMAFLNLNIGFSVCFYNDMNNLSKMALNFAFPLYLWCIVLGLVLISRYSTKVANLTVGSSVQVLATLVQFSFSKILLAVCDTLTSSSILISSNNYSSFSAWYFEGNMKYFAGKHLVLCLVSLAFLLLFILPFLIFTSFFSYIKSCRSVSFRLQPVLDAYNGPYKDRYRFWFGVRQWLMVLLYVLYSVLRGDYPKLMLFINVIAITGFMVIQICLKPFKSFFINVIDIWFLFLLFISNNVAYFLISNRTTVATTTSSAAVSTILSVYLSSVLVILIYHMLVSTRKMRKVAKVLVNLSQDSWCGLKMDNGVVNHDKDHYRVPLLVAVDGKN